MPSFDIVSEINMQEVDNAVNQTAKEIAQRFDFRGTGSTIELDKKEKLIKIHSNSEQKIETIVDLFQSRAFKRGLEITAFKVGKPSPTTGSTLKSQIELLEGIEGESAKKITKFIKEQKVKVQAQIQDEKVRITGKKRDELQDVIALLKAENFDVPLQFNNFRD